MTHPPHGHQPPPRIPRSQDIAAMVAATQQRERDQAAAEREQDFRTEAGHMASMLLGDCSGTPAGIAARLVELAEPIADWIRDGTRPAGGCSCQQVDVSPPHRPRTEFVPGVTDPRCPEHGSRP